MFWGMGIAIACSFALGYLWWPKDTRSWRVVASTGFVLSAFITAGIYISQLWPADHIKIEKIQKKYVNPPAVVYKDRVVYKAPDGEVAPVDVEQICKGKTPVQIVRMLESTNKEDDSDKTKTMTWISGRPVGSKILVTYGIPGAFESTGIWEVGDIVQFVRGEAQ